MAGLKQLIHEIHRRSLWQVLAIYVAASWAVLEAADVIVARFSLPEWVYGAAIMLLLVGLPIVLATAFVQEGISPEARQDPTLLPGAEVESEGAARGEAQGLRRLLTWRNAIMGGALAFGLWGVVATGWLAFRGAGDAAEGQPFTSLAVLPLSNFMGEDPEQEYFVDGMTDRLTAELSKIGELIVKSRTSVMRYKNTQLLIPEIGEELGADVLVEGSVLKAGDRVSITVQLIDAAADRHL